MNPGNPITVDEYEQGVLDGKFKGCSLNRLKSFHSVHCFPFDYMQDLLVGVAPKDLKGVIDILIKEKMFKVEDYNLRLSNFTLLYTERNNKPFVIKKDAEKLAGKGLSVQTHLRLFPMIIEPFIPEGLLADSVQDNEKSDGGKTAIMVALHLHQILELCCADPILPYQLDIMGNVITSYFKHRHILSRKYPDSQFAKVSPEHHYLQHYPEQISEFGPLLRCWTGRAEAKHRLDVNVISSAKNLKNVPFLLAKRTQMRNVVDQYDGLFSTNPAQLVEGSQFRYKNIEYNPGMVLVLEAETDYNLNIGIIKTIQFLQGKPTFVVNVQVKTKCNFLLLGCWSSYQPCH